MIGVEVGHKFYGFCGGYFGRDSYCDKTVVVVGTDFLVVRGEEYGEAFYDLLQGDSRDGDKFADYCSTVKYLLENHSAPEEGY